jgi:hypothetical protein
MKRISFVSAALVIVAMAFPAAARQVNFNVNIGPPPPVVVPAAPTMLYLGQPGVYSAVGVPYDIFYVDDRYYYYQGSNWFWGPGYSGPWTYVTYKALPPGLRNYKVVTLREYRDREYRVYRQNAAGFNGRHFVASPGRGNGNGNGNGNGRGRGHAKH